MNNIFMVILSVLVGVLAGVSLLLGINNTVMNANIPIFSEIQKVVNNEVELQKKVVGLENKLSEQTKLMEALSAKTDKIVIAAERPAPAPVAVAAAPVQPNQPPAEDMNKVYDIPVGNSVIIGKKDAPVTIVMFSDFQCPFCNRFYPGVKETLKNYPNKVRLIVKNFPLPFHPNARPAAKLALAANEQGKYKEMMELLMDNGADVSDAKIKEYAKAAGINYNRLVADFKNNDAKYEAQLEADSKLIQTSDVRGTPTFYVNGKKVNARDAAGYKEIIDKL